MTERGRTLPPPAAPGRRSIRLLEKFSGRLLTLRSKHFLDWVLSVYGILRRSLSQTECCTHHRWRSSRTRIRCSHSTQRRERSCGSTLLAVPSIPAPPLWTAASIGDPVIHDQAWKVAGTLNCSPSTLRIRTRIRTTTRIK